jgi:hypothetical protein
MVASVIFSKKRGRRDRESVELNGGRELSILGSDVDIAVEKLVM